MPREENCSDLVEPPTEEEMDQAITGNMSRLMVVMKAVKRFKELIRKGSNSMDGIFGRDSKIVAPPLSVQPRSKSTDVDDRRPVERALVTEGVHRHIEIDEEAIASPSTMDTHAVRSAPSFEITNGVDRGPDETVAHWKQRLETEAHHPAIDPQRHRSHPSSQGVRAFSLDDDRGKGHARDPLTEKLYLQIGANPESAGDHDKSSKDVSESPGGVDENIYEQAYQEEMAKILQRQGESTNLHLNRRVEHIENLRSHPNIIASTKQHAANTSNKLGSKLSEATGGGKGIFASLVKHMQTEPNDPVDNKDHVSTNEE